MQQRPSRAIVGEPELSLSSAPSCPFVKGLARLAVPWKEALDTQFLKGNVLRCPECRDCREQLKPDSVFLKVHGQHRTFRSWWRGGQRRGSNAIVVQESLKQPRRLGGAVRDRVCLHAPQEVSNNVRPVRKMWFQDIRRGQRVREIWYPARTGACLPQRPRRSWPACSATLFRRKPRSTARSGDAALDVGDGGR